MWNNKTLVLAVQKKQKKTDLSNEFLFFCLFVSDVGIIVSVEILLLVTSAPTNDC